MHLVDSDIPKLVYRPWRGGGPSVYSNGSTGTNKNTGTPPLIVRPKVAYFGPKS